MLFEDVCCRWAIVDQSAALAGITPAPEEAAEKSEKPKGKTPCLQPIQIDKTAEQGPWRSLSYMAMSHIDEKTLNLGKIEGPNSHVLELYAAMLESISIEAAIHSYCLDISKKSA